MKELNMDSSAITKMTIIVEIEGKPYFVLIPTENKAILIRAMAGLSEGGNLNVLAAPDTYKFVKLEDELNLSSKEGE